MDPFLRPKNGDVSTQTRVGGFGSTHKNFASQNFSRTTTAIHIRKNPPRGRRPRRVFPVRRHFGAKNGPKMWRKRTIFNKIFIKIFHRKNFYRIFVKNCHFFRSVWVHFWTQNGDVSTQTRVGGFGSTDDNRSYDCRRPKNALFKRVFFSGLTVSLLRNDRTAANYWDPNKNNFLNLKNYFYWKSQ